MKGALLSVLCDSAVPLTALCCPPGFSIQLV